MILSNIGAKYELVKYLTERDIKGRAFNQVPSNNAISRQTENLESSERVEVEEKW